MNNPFFSILLPTKNRANYLRESILSVLLQDFNSYELIISDNFNTEETKKVIDEFIDHPNLKYYRTDEELGMPDNWEFALSKATGKYIMVLPDRKLLYEKALNYLNKSIVKNKFPESCSWTVKVYNDEKKHMGWFPHEIKPVRDRWFSSKQIISNFLSQKYLSPKSLDFYYPKSLNGCFKKELADKMKSFTGFFFNNEFATTPDYSSLFIQLAYANKILFISKPIYLAQGESSSNGRYSSSVDCMPYLKSLRFNDYYHYVSIKAPFIYNLLINDFLCIKALVGGNLSTFETDKVNYYASLVVDLKSIKAKGLMDDENFEKYNQELNANLNKEQDSLKEKVKIRIEKINTELVTKVNYIHSIKLHIRDYFRNNYSHIAFINKILQYKFDNALLAAGFKKQDL